MALDELEPSSLAAADRQRHSRMEPGPRSGPNKDGATAPDGASALGNELGGEADARRERQEALAEGDQLPPLQQTSGPGQGRVGDLGFGQPNGADLGYGQDLDQGQRQSNQDRKNEAWQDGQAADLGAIARNSAGTANYNPTQDPDSIVSSANRSPADLLDQAGRSNGTESGTGAYDGGIVNQADTDNVAN